MLLYPAGSLKMFADLPSRLLVLVLMLEPCLPCASLSVENRLKNRAALKGGALWQDPWRVSGIQASVELGCVILLKLTF